MEKKEKDKEMLYIPQGLKSEVEIFEGFGKTEILETAISVLVVAGISFLYKLITGNELTAILILLSGAFASVSFHVKADNNLSIKDQLQFLFNFMRSKKKYPYETTLKVKKIQAVFIEEEFGEEDITHNK